MAIEMARWRGRVEKRSTGELMQRRGRDLMTKAEGGSLWESRGCGEEIGEGKRRRRAGAVLKATVM